MENVEYARDKVGRCLFPGDIVQVINSDHDWFNTVVRVDRVIPESGHTNVEVSLTIPGQHKPLTTTLPDMDLSYVGIPISPLRLAQKQYDIWSYDARPT